MKKRLVELFIVFLVWGMLIISDAHNVQSKLNEDFFFKIQGMHTTAQPQANPPNNNNLLNNNNNPPSPPPIPIPPPQSPEEPQKKIKEPTTIIHTKISTEEKIPCIITSIEWGATKAVQGQEVLMTAIGSQSCDKLIITFSIYRGETLLETLPSQFYTTTAQVSWTIPSKTSDKITIVTRIRSLLFGKSDEEKTVSIYTFSTPNSPDTSAPTYLISNALTIEDSQQSLSIFKKSKQKIVKNIQLKMDLKDREGKNIPADVRIYNKEKKQLQELKSGEIKIVSTFEDEMLGAKMDLPKESSVLRDIKVEDIEITGIDSNDGEHTLIFDYIPSKTMAPHPKKGNWEKVYAVDPTGAAFEEALITIIASGSELYKCKDWDFAQRVCLGIWEKIADIQPGQPYTITISRTDPAFGESGQVCGNGVIEVGEQCGEPGLVCLSNQVCNACVCEGGASISASSSLIGTNLAWLQSYNPQFISQNAMDWAREWVSQNADGSGAWDNGYTPPADANGYPLVVPFDPDGSGPAVPQKVRTIMLDSFGGTYPRGTYTLVLGGSGQVRLTGDTGTQVYNAPGTYSVPINTPSNTGIHLEVLQSSASNHINQIEFIMPGFASTYQNEFFHPKFIELLNNFSTLRAMDLLRTNNNDLNVQWSDRRPPTYYTQSGQKGIALEHLARLANEADVDLWVNVPHLADDNYVREMARLLRNQINSQHKVYLEFSNEVWNGIFGQTQYAIAQGCALDLARAAGWTIYGTCNDGVNDGGDRYWNALAWYARRSGQVFQIFDEEFNGANSNRLIKVIGGFAPNPQSNQRVLEALANPVINPTSARADAIAITTYYGGNIADTIGSSGQAGTITVGEIIDLLRQSLEGQTRSFIISSKQIADQFNVSLYAYEGNHHLAAVTQQNNQVLIDKLIQTYQDPRMRDLTNEMFDVWFNAGGGLHMWFTYISPDSRYGGWGSLKYQDQDHETAPMWLGVQDAIAGHGGGGGPTTPSAPSSLQAAPQSSTAINLGWIDTANNEDYFEVERRTPPSGSFAVILTGANLTPNTQTFSDSGLTPSTTYEYRVFAANTYGRSPASNIASATTTSCTNGQQRACSNQVGVCVGSMETCASGQWPGCNVAAYTAHSVNYRISEVGVCRDAMDNDCDGSLDYDGAGSIIGDSDCPVGVTAINSPATICPATSFTLQCTATTGNVRSVQGFINTQSCVFTGWSNAVAAFTCTSQANTGQQTVRCAINTAYSTQIGVNQSTSLTVGGANCCNQYGSQNSCIGDAACAWCASCQNNQYSGGTDRCVQAGTCSRACVGNQCGATCDGTSGGCAQTQTCDTNACGCIEQNPSIYLLAPNQARVSVSIPLTLTGSFFAANAEVIVDGVSINASRMNSQTANIIVFQDQPFDYALGMHTIQVRNPNTARLSNEVNLSVTGTPGVIIIQPADQEVTNTTTTRVEFSVIDWRVGGKEEDHINFNLDNVPGYTYEDHFMFYNDPDNVVEFNAIPGLTPYASWVDQHTLQFFNVPEGRHRLRAHLVNSQNATPNNPEADTFIDFIVNLPRVNRPPFLFPIGNFTIAEGEPLQIHVEATDPDNDLLTYTATGLPSGAVFFNQTFRWSPEENTTGSYLIHFVVTDNGVPSLSVFEDVLITVDSPLDSDGDGVPNFRDRCPNTPLGIMINRYNGCPLPRATIFDDNLTTNFSEVQDLEAIDDLRMGIINKGQIRFIGRNVSLLQYNNLQLRHEAVNLENIHIGDNNITLNTNDSNNLSMLNKPATLILYNLSFASPRILRDGAVCTSCIIFNYADGSLEFDVPGFSTYSAEESPTPPGGSSGSGGSSGGGGGGGGGGGSQNVLVDLDAYSQQTVVSYVNSRIAVKYKEKEYGIRLLKATKEEVTLVLPALTYKFPINTQMKVDLSGDGKYIHIEFNEYQSNKATLTFSALASETSASLAFTDVSLPKQKQEQEQVVNKETPQEEKVVKKSFWMKGVIVGLILLLILYWRFIYFKKPAQPKEQNKSLLTK